MRSKNYFALSLVFACSALFGQDICLGPSKSFAGFFDQPHPSTLGSYKWPGRSVMVREPPDECTISWCPIQVDLTLALDDFRSLPDGSGNGNWGALAAAQLKIPLPESFFLQLAGSFGLYDWSGRSSVPRNSKSLQQQGFITLAACRTTPDSSGCNAAVAYDWQLNKNFGVYALNPFMDQIRAQIGYLIEGGNEIGLWTGYGIRKVHKTFGQTRVAFRAISQLNVFWCYYFKTHGYAMLWAGSPYRRGLMYKSGRPGDYIFGVQFSAPMTTSLSIQGHGAYMGARGGSGEGPSKRYAADLCIGITYTFGKRRSQQNPYTTLANNSNFIVDTNRSF